MSRMYISRAFVVYYSPNLVDEQPPQFIEGEGCDCRDCSALFVHTVKNLEKVFNKLSDRYQVSVLAHGLKDESQELAEQIEKAGLLIDYSSSDPLYEHMWIDIRTAKDCCQLVERLEYWISHYTIDPIRRIKHRGLNLFAPLDTDCQVLLEMWQRGDYDAARRYLEELQRDWQGEPPYSNAPLSKLARFWYMLVGDGIEWPYWVKDLTFWKHLSIEKPDKVVSLPKRRAAESEGLCLYTWLKKIGKESSQEWWKILLEAGLNSKGQKFEPDSQAGIYRFVVELQKRVIEGNLAELRPETPMQGFANCTTVEQNFREFRRWLRRLNNAFEALLEEIGEATWTGDSSSSRGTSGNGG